jgi:hypothetical protein
MMDNLGPNGSLMEMSNSEPFIMENPFIRPVKMPLSKKKSSP